MNETNKDYHIIHLMRVSMVTIKSEFCCVKYKLSEEYMKLTLTRGHFFYNLNEKTAIFNYNDELIYVDLDYTKIHHLSKQITAVYHENDDLHIYDIIQFFYNF